MPSETQHDREYAAEHQWCERQRIKLSRQDLIATLTQRLYECKSEGGRDAVTVCLEMAWYFNERTLRSQNIIGALQQRLTSCDSEWPRSSIEAYLQTELTLAGRHDEADAFVHARIQKNPDSEMNYIILAERSHYCRGNLQYALDYAEQGLALADRSGNWRRHARAVMARIHLELGDYTRFEKTINEIAMLTFKPGAQDVRLERDFFDKADRSKLDPKTVRAFETYLLDGGRANPR